MTDRSAASGKESIDLLAGDAWGRARDAAASGDRRAALFWYDRVLRLAPDDPRPRLERTRLVLADDAVAALGSFLDLATGFDLAEAWASAAALALRLGRIEAAVTALTTLLSRQRIAAGGEVARLADAVVEAAGAPGWCGIALDGRLLLAAATPVTVDLDGTRQGAVARADLRRGARLDAACDGTRLVGSPLDLAAQHRVIGIADAERGAIVGWACRPATPDKPPRLVLEDAEAHCLSIRPGKRLAPADTAPFLPRWGFTVSARRLAGLTPPFRVRSDSGALFGTPIDPMPAARLKARRVRGRPSHKTLRRDVPPIRPLAVVIPAFRGATDMAALLDALAGDNAVTPPVVVDDASPEPALRRLLRDAVRQGRIHLVRHRRNLGFPAAVNSGIRAARRQFGVADILILNSDTVVPPGIVGRLHDLLYASPDIGSVTPLSNEATIMSYPKRQGGNPCLAVDAVQRTDRLAWRANRNRLVTIPTAIGFCMAIRHDALAATGLFDALLFAQGYGEENDWCLRARAQGFRHMGAPGLYVGHRGGSSFGPAGAALRARNLRRLEDAHPGYHAEIEAHHREDPLHDARRRLDLARFRASAAPPEAVVLVTHDHGGGIARVVEDRIGALVAGGLRPILLQPDFSHLAAFAEAADDATPIIGCTRVGDRYAPDYPNLLYDLPREWPALLRLLRGARVRHVEFHHVMGQHPSIRTLAERLGVAADHVVHDYASLCKRVNLVGPARRYCGEPGPVGCVSCLAAGDVPLADPEPSAEFLARNAAWLGAARTIRAPSADAARRLRRHFPDAADIAVTPWEDDAALPPAKPPGHGYRRIAVAGGIGPAKGYDILLHCAQDAAARDLPLDFVLIGAADGEQALIDTGRVVITGPYQEGQAESLIRGAGPTLGFLPSIWPETWCFTLGELWRAGLYVLAFDLGAQAERIRRTGRGALLPLGLPPSRINESLLAWTPDLRDLPGRFPGSPDEIRSPALSLP